MQPSDDLTLPWDAPKARPILRWHPPEPAGAGRFKALGSRLYSATSALPFARWPSVTPTLLTYLVHVADALAEEIRFDAMLPDYPVAAASPGPLWVAFSGGKDGLAAAIKARNEGWDVVLYHVAGINRSYPDERQWAEAAARELRLPLVVDEVVVNGRGGDFIEMPTKNQVIVAGMVERMVLEGGSTYSLGAMTADTPETMVAELNWSDNTEAIALWHGHLAALAPGLEMRYFLRHETESIAILREADALHLAHGCMTPLRYRSQLRERNVTKYGSLLPGRCGSCTKCCWEYLVLHHLGADLRERLYEHCLEFMKARLKVEHPDDTTGDPLHHYVDFEIIKEYTS